MGFICVHPRSSAAKNLSRRLQFPQPNLVFPIFLTGIGKTFHGDFAGSARAAEFERAKIAVGDKRPRHDLFVGALRVQI